MLCCAAFAFAMHQMGSILYWWSDTLNVPVTIALMGVNGTTIICFLFCLVRATTEKWVELFQGVCVGNTTASLSRAAVWECRAHAATSVYRVLVGPTCQACALFYPFTKATLRSPATGDMVLL